MQMRNEREEKETDGKERGEKEKWEKREKEKKVKRERKRKIKSLVAVYRMRPVYVRSFALQP